MTLGEKLQSLRKSRGLSQEELASKITISRQAISKWELNETMPDIDNLKQLSKILEVSIDFLLDDDVSDTKSLPVIKKVLKEEKTKINKIWFLILLLGIILTLIISNHFNIMMSVWILIITTLSITVIIKIISFIKKKKRRI